MQTWCGPVRQNAEMAFCLPLFLYKRGARENQTPDNRCPYLLYGHKKIATCFEVTIFI